MPIIRNNIKPISIDREIVENKSLQAYELAVYLFILTKDESYNFKLSEIQERFKYAAKSDLVNALLTLHTLGLVKTDLTIEDLDNG